jgi:NAD(P)-dependent dehydrogenase (short-subunit alcohol dehydrogenase family)
LNQLADWRGKVMPGMVTTVAYQATEAGVSAVTRHNARTYGKQNVRANSVSPGLVLTEQTKLNRRVITGATSAVREQGHSHRRGRL